ncbi:MAG: DNA gyrase inhibitor YacG [Pseudomonadota bacterium]
MASPQISKPVLVVKCPQCRKSVAWQASSRFRPFCSSRCQLMDLGAWANEDHRLPEVEPSVTEDDVRSQ